MTGTLAGILETSLTELDTTTATSVKTAVAEYLIFGDARLLRRDLKALLGKNAQGTIEEITTSLRHRMDAKNIWKAVWSVFMRKMAIADAAKEQNVHTTDVTFVITSLSKGAIERFILTTDDTDVRSNIAESDIVAMLEPLRKHVKRIVRRMRFIAKYDAGTSMEDLENELMVKAFRTLRDYQDMEDVKGGTTQLHLLNLARKSASTGAIDIIEHHTSASRARIQGVYVCEACSCSAMSKTDVCAQCGAKMSEANRTYMTTTVMNGLDKTMCSVIADDYGEYVDLLEDLEQNLDPKAKRYLRILLREDAEFDAWLNKKNQDSDSLSDIAVRNLASTYLGEEKEALDSRLYAAVQNARRQ